jgi:hypothetical protein
VLRLSLRYRLIMALDTSSSLTISLRGYPYPWLVLLVLSNPGSRLALDSFLPTMVLSKSGDYSIMGSTLVLNTCE